MTEVEKCMASLEKMKMEEENFFGGEEDNDENEDLTNFEDIKNKSIGELLNESNRKIERKLGARKEEDEPEEESSS